MKVNDGLQGVPGALEVSQASPVSAVQPEQKAVFSTTANNIQDRTEVSTAASLAHQAMSLPDVRMDKVAAVQQALANGTYHVSVDDLAAKLVGQMMGE